MHYFLSLHFHSCPANRLFYSSCTQFHWGGLQVLRQHWTENIALEDQIKFLDLLHSLLFTEMQLKAVKSCMFFITEGQLIFKICSLDQWLSKILMISSSLFISFSEKESIHSLLSTMTKESPRDHLLLI